MADGGARREPAEARASTVGSLDRDAGEGGASARAALVVGPALVRGPQRRSHPGMDRRRPGLRVSERGGHPPGDARPARGARHPQSMLAGDRAAHPVDHARVGRASLVHHHPAAALADRGPRGGDAAGGSAARRTLSRPLRRRAARRVHGSGGPGRSGPRATGGGAEPGRTVRTVAGLPLAVARALHRPHRDAVRAARPGPRPQVAQDRDPQGLSARAVHEGGGMTHLPPDDAQIESVVGPQLVTRIHGLLRAVRLYDLSNQAIRDQVKDLAELLAAVMEDEVVLVSMGQCFYVNGVRVRAMPSQLTVFDALSVELEQRRLGGVRLLEGLRPDELGTFLKILAAEPAGEHAPTRIAEAATAAGVLNATPVTLEELQSLGTEQASAAIDPASGERGRARETFTRAVSGARRAIQGAARTGKPAIRRVKRVIQPIVDTIMKNEYSIVGLTALKQHDEYTYVHCVNVSILSVAMGHTLGMLRTSLANLGVAALLHDLGKLDIPSEILMKAGPLDEAEWARMHRHPIEGLKMASRMPGLPSTTLDLMRVCLEHHRMYNGAGYPPAPAGSRSSTLSRIVAAADCFDAMTAHRSYRDRPFTGYEALQTMLGPNRDQFDPATLWALVKSVGLYPAGSLLQTSSGYLVISLSSNSEDPRRPHCRVLARRDGSIPSDSLPELWEPMPDDEHVVRVVPPDEFDFEVEQLLAA